MTDWNRQSCRPSIFGQIDLHSRSHSSLSASKPYTWLLCRGFCAPRSGGHGQWLQRKLSARSKTKWLLMCYQARPLAPEAPQPRWRDLNRPFCRCPLARKHAPSHLGWPARLRDSRLFCFTLSDTQLGRSCILYSIYVVENSTMAKSCVRLGTTSPSYGKVTRKMTRATHI